MAIGSAKSAKGSSEKKRGSSAKKKKGKPAKKAKKKRRSSASKREGSGGSDASGSESDGGRRSDASDDGDESEDEAAKQIRELRQRERAREREAAEAEREREQREFDDFQSNPFLSKYKFSKDGAAGGDAAAAAPRRRKVTKSFVDERGYFVTEDVWETVTDENEADGGHAGTAAQPLQIDDKENEERKSSPQRRPAATRQADASSPRSKARTGSILKETARSGSGGGSGGAKGKRGRGSKRNAGDDDSVSGLGKVEDPNAAPAPKLKAAPKASNSLFNYFKK
jgi:hypothetical protein